MRRIRKVVVVVAPAYLVVFLPLLTQAWTAAPRPRRVPSLSSSSFSTRIVPRIAHQSTLLSSRQQSATTTITSTSITTTTTIPRKRRTTTTRLRDVVSADSDWDRPSAVVGSPSPCFSSLSRDAALAIIPPDDAWDTIQRARFQARDPSFTKWPPALRLLHPLSSPRRRNNHHHNNNDAEDDVALAVARVVDRHQLEPFEIVLSEWSVIPHAEAMEADWKAMRALPSSVGADADYDHQYQLSPEDQAVQRLIAHEEAMGKQRARQKEARARRSAAAARHNNNNNSTTATTKSSSTPKPTSSSTSSSYDHKSPRALWEKQKQMYEEFNGPCVVCLEPDAASRKRITKVRQLLLEDPDLAGFALYSPTGTLSDHFSFSTDTYSAVDYRPIVPIASFPTVSSAVEMARTLRQVWDPLSFLVTDLQLVSVRGNHDRGTWRRPDASATTTTTTTTSETDSSSSSSDHGGGGGSSSVWQSERFWEDAAVGCDALVMLAGEELTVDVDDDAAMAALVERDGEAGGYYYRIDHDGLADDGGEIRSAVEDLLAGDDDDDDDDEGTVVVIGRTHFFTGAMRHYVGMPATSATDAQDILGLGSGAAKRKASSFRRDYKDGEWGQRRPRNAPRWH